MLPNDDLKEIFKAWYTRQMPALYRYIWYQVHDQALAEELTAAVCERALHILDRYDPQRGSFNAWMFGIARNEILNARRTARRRPEPLSLDGLPDLQADIPPVEGVYQTQEMVAFILQKLTTLPEQAQEIVALRYGAGFSNREIAGLTGLTENHIAVVLHRALKTLRDAFEMEYAESAGESNNGRP